MELTKLVSVDLEEYLELRQESEQLKNVIKIILENSTKSNYDKKLTIYSGDKIYDYLKLIASEKYNARIEELKNEEE